jgi:hypothetical protein
VPFVCDLDVEERINIDLRSDVDLDIMIFDKGDLSSGYALAEWTPFMAYMTNEISSMDSSQRQNAGVIW